MEGEKKKVEEGKVEEEKEVGWGRKRRGRQEKNGKKMSFT